MAKRIAILGATGSIGNSTCRVIDRFPDDFNLVYLSARQSVDRLFEQAKAYRPEVIAVGNTEAAKSLSKKLKKAGLGTKVVFEEDESLAALAACQPELAVSAIVGAAGLAPTLAAVEAGADLALANKESMVVAGSFVKQACTRKGVAILPVDSEHNAIHQCLRGEKAREVKRIVLTASGGPFRNFEGDFATITPQAALKHPTWNMGPKISIDSATMMNKGLEVIEAHYLFDMPGERIDIVVHPQSIVHSMIETVDGSYLCQLGKTDMVHPIQYALTYPTRLPDPFEGFDITKGATLSFFPPDPIRFPCIKLAYEALALEGTAPAVLNAANEVAVEAFLKEQIRFTDIPRVLETCLEKSFCGAVNTLEALLEVDTETRVKARETIMNGLV